MSAVHIPQIDIAPFLSGDDADKKSVAAQFADAFERTGFATIVGHGVDFDVVQASYDMTRAFFDLDFAEKAEVMQEGEHKSHGYMPLGIQSVAQTMGVQLPPDLCEALVYAGVAWDRRPCDKPIYRQYKRENLWPRRPEGLRKAVSDCYWELDDLAGTLMRIAALALDLPEDYFTPFYDRRACTFRSVLYPAYSGTVQKDQERNGAHRDYGGLTILKQDDSPDVVQACLPSGEWIDVRTPPEALVINVGDLMARWTNDRWISTLHRVPMPAAPDARSRRRQSIVLFTGPNVDAVVECLPTCQGPGNPAKYPPVRAIDHLMEKIAASTVKDTQPAAAE